MARLPRLILPGQPHHVILRGNNRQAIFFSDLDRQHLLAPLGEVAAQYGVAIHAYVLMDNHFHLLLTPQSTQALSRLMQSLGRRYVGWFNARHHRSGTLWEVDEGTLVRFRCRVGHSYSAGAMDASQGTAVEAALWTAMRSRRWDGSVSR